MENIGDYTEIITSSLVSLLGVVLSWWLKTKYGAYKTNKSNREITQAKLIQTILDQQRIDYSAQRSFILQRHTLGTMKYGNGKTMDRLSTTYESCETGVSTEFQNYQNVPLSLYSSFIDAVMNNTAIYPSVDDIDDILTKTFFVQRSSKSAIVFSILQNGNIIGFVGFEWTHRLKNIESLCKDIAADSAILGETLSKLLQ